MTDTQTLYHIKALFLRHLLPLKRDFDLWSDMVYWPLIDVVLWGITGRWLVDTSGLQYVVVAILTGLVLWNVIWRSQSEISRNLIDEFWNNNLVNLFATPLSPNEWIFGMLMLSILKTTVTLSVIIPVIFLLYSVNVFSIGLPLAVFFFLTVMTGWWLGFISSGIVLRYGPKFQTVIWSLPAILLPFSAVYFPLERLPEILRPISFLLPTTYVFESMRSVLDTGILPLHALVASFVLNCIYLVFAAVYFLSSFRKSKDLGLGRFD